MERCSLALLCALSAGGVWANPADFAPVQYEHQTWRTENGLPQNSVHAITQTSDGFLWVATEGGVARFDGLKFDTEAGNKGPAAFPSSDLSLVAKLNLAQQLPGKKITAVFEDRAGTVWVGTETGALRMVKGRVYGVASPDPLANEFILCFFQDREGDIWVGTDSGGLTVLREQRFRKYGREDGIPEELVRCVFEDSHGVLWAGTSAHGLRKFEGQRFSSMTAAAGLTSDVILSLAEDARGRLLAGTPDGLNILTGKRVLWLTSADGLPDDFIRSIYKDGDGSLWMGTRRGLAHYDVGRVTNYTTSDGLPSDLIGATLRGSDGCLWAGTLKGLARRCGGARWAAVGHRDAAITALFQDSAGVLWVGTDAAGLARWDGNRWFSYPPTLGLPSNISGIVEDGHGQLWITSPHGLFRARRGDLGIYAAGRVQSVPFSSYGTSDGLPVNEFAAGGHPTVWKDRKNTIWLASAKGAVSMDALHTEPNPIAPAVVIEQVAADDRLLNPRQGTEFGPGVSRLSFAYAGLSFAAPQQVRFKYRLEGFDEAWVDAGTRRTAYYTNLPPGHYRFVVLARNNDGLWASQGADLSFQLRPHYYQTNWFRVFLLMALVGVVYAFYRWRVEYVRSQFDAVMAERNRIAREIHDTLAQGFVAVSLKLELARRLMRSSSEEAVEAIEQAQTLVQQSLGEARRSIWDLRSGAPGDENLGSKLSKVVRQAMGDNAADLKIHITGAQQRLPERVESELLRIGQEAVTNITRHAGATQVNVTLAFDANKARMTISDDGRGFAPGDYANGMNGHFGLRGMRERAKEIRGELTVTSAPGHGTQICLELPVK
ncbi:MAG: hypothetical protein JO051_08795 [Acidobacteriaceae bacterium]|nr:hypothetical protein [Acidobacteriaceae bacterium]